MSPHTFISDVFNLSSNRVSQIGEELISSNSFDLGKSIDVAFFLSTSTVFHNITYTSRSISKSKNNLEECFGNDNIYLGLRGWVRSRRNYGACRDACLFGGRTLHRFGCSGCRCGRIHQLSVRDDRRRDPEGHLREQDRHCDIPV